MNANMHVFSKEVEGEITERLAMWEPDESNDFETITRSDVVKDLMQYTDESDHAFFGFCRKELRQFGIDVGVYREMSKWEMDHTHVASSSGRSVKKYDFKQNGKFYIFDSWDKLFASEGEKAVA